MSLRTNQNRACQSIKADVSLCFNQTYCLLQIVMLSFANYINQVRGILESLPPPEVIPMGMDRSAVTDRILDQLQKIVKSESVETVRVFHGFSEINPFERNEAFREHAKESLPWAVWKTDGIKGLIKIAIDHYLKNGGPMECEEEEWKKLGELMMESIFSARWPVGALQPKPECSICTEPLYTQMTLPCGHAFHMECTVRWLEMSNSCPLCRAFF
ncbi:hypothetical protein AVEN_67916-1 [Araneus ventricosus]|uniref:RING-type domain-containing protein n=1 Tax=Araneus ventricosus TaxID=182803 RepID=A0A4Y2Q534_ARAVE|nr:hypothetical protein AVEN_67916-1 [Araneus ventricosus]